MSKVVVLGRCLIRFHTGNELSRASRQRKRPCRLLTDPRLPCCFPYACHERRSFITPFPTLLSNSGHAPGTNLRRLIDTYAPVAIDNIKLRSDKSGDRKLMAANC